MQTDDVVIHNSKIQGKGVFAKRDFQAGEIILKWDVSHILSERDVISMNEEAKKYVCFFDNKYILIQEPERYINHSCEANTTVKDFCDVAKRDIQKGEEITGDYREDLPPNTIMKCNCGSESCIKVIKSE